VNPKVILFPCPSEDGYAGLLSDGEMNAAKDSDGRRDFSRQPICVHLKLNLKKDRNCGI
jgi:hypothetical protein